MLIAALLRNIESLEFIKTTTFIRAYLGFTYFYF